MTAYHEIRESNQLTALNLCRLELYCLLPISKIHSIIEIVEAG